MRGQLPQNTSPLLNWLRSRVNRGGWWGWGLVLFTLLLSSLLLPNPLTADDFYHRIFFLGSETLSEQGFQASGAGQSPYVASREMFSFFSSSNNNKEQLHALGFSPWWADESLQVSFWRPLTALTHWLDYALWPHAPSMMRLHSLIWYAGAVGLAWLLFRRLTRRRSIAILASLIFALDTTHLETVHWLAARNGLLALTMSLISVIALDVAFENAHRRAAYLLSYFAFLAALLSGEAGASALLLVGGYALFFHPPYRLKRLLIYLPYLLIFAGWLMSYQRLGYGVSSSGFYLDLASQGGEFLSHTLIRLPLLAMTALTGGGAFLNLLPAQILPYLSGAMLPLLFGVFYLTRFRLRANPALAWGWFVLFATVLPVSAATIFSPRLFLFVSLGGALVVAHLLVWLTDRLESGISGIKRALFRLGQSYLVVVHLIGSGVIWLLIGGVSIASIWSAPEDPLLPVLREMAGERVMVIHSPHSFAMLYLPFMIDQKGESFPQSFHLLLPGFHPFRLSRSTTHHIEMESEEGVWIPSQYRAVSSLKTPMGITGLMRTEHFFRSPLHPLHEGADSLYGEMRVTVLDVDEESAQIYRIQFESLHPDGFDSMQWYEWDLRTHHYQLVSPLDVGESRSYRGYLKGVQAP